MFCDPVRMEMPSIRLRNARFQITQSNFSNAYVKVITSLWMRSIADDARCARAWNTYISLFFFGHKNQIQMHKSWSNEMHVLHIVIITSSASTSSLNKTANCIKLPFIRSPWLRAVYAMCALYIPAIHASSSRNLFHFNVFRWFLLNCFCCCWILYGVDRTPILITITIHSRTCSCRFNVLYFFVTVDLLISTLPTTGLLWSW